MDDVEVGSGDVTAGRMQLVLGRVQPTLDDVIVRRCGRGGGAGAPG